MKALLLSKLLVSVCTVSSALGARVLYQLPILNAVSSDDGFQRLAVLANGTSPGPILKFNKGDRVQINVTSALTDPRMRRSTSIHWHGLFQARTAGNDGPAMVTQCPISPGHSFLYDFDLAEQAGTFWYHSHLSTQYCDGLRGAFVIYDPRDPQKHLYDVDDDTTVIQLADYYHNPAPALQAKFFNDAVVPIPDAGLINGKGRFVGGPTGAAAPFHVLNVKSGVRYRLRFINEACRPSFTVSIDKHNLTIIEADGINHVPHTVGSFAIFVAQRYSAVLTANQPVANYWMRAPPAGGVGGPTGNPNLDATLTLAVVHYAGAPDAEPDGSTNSTATDLLLEQDLAVLTDPGSPGGNVPADVHFDMIITQPNPPFFEINGISFEPPALPALLQILSGATNANDFLPHENMQILPQNKIIEVSIPGTGAHPIHLHGHAFDVIRSSNSNVTNFVNPPRRDVVAVNGGNTTFRFRTDNPGPWFLHCHIDWHLEVGLAVILGEAPAAERTGKQSQITSPAWNQLCPIYNQLDPSFQ